MSADNSWRILAVDCLPSSADFIVLSTWFECSDMLGGATSRLLYMVGRFVHCRNATS